MQTTQITCILHHTSIIKWLTNYKHSQHRLKVANKYEFGLIIFELKICIAWDAYQKNPQI